MAQSVPPKLVRRRAEFLIENLHGYLEFGESRIEQALQEQDEEVRSLDQALIDTYGDDLWTDADVEFLQERWGCGDPDAPDRPYSPLHYVFPRYLRYSFITLAALVFESELLVLCLSLADNLGVPPPAAGGKSSTVQKARAFVLANMGPSAIDDKVWNRLQDMLKVRNCIVHAGGRVDLSTDTDHIQALAKQGIGLYLDSEERPGVRLLSIQRKYCESVVEAMAALFGSICDAAGY